MENAKFKETLLYLKTENSEFSRYNEILSNAITQISDSNEKLLSCLNEKCQFLSKLEKDNKYIEESAQNKLNEVKTYDFNNWQITGNEDITKSGNNNDEIINQSKNQFKASINDDSSNHSSTNSVLDANTKLKNELNDLLAIFGENELFSRYQQMSNDCLKLNQELRQLSHEGNQAKEEELKKAKQQNEERLNMIQRTRINGQIRRKMSVRRTNLTDSLQDMKATNQNDPIDFQSDSHSSINKDFNVEQSGENKLSRSCQTVDNIKSTEIGQKLSDQLNQKILNRQLRKIEQKKTEISEINSQIEKLKLELTNNQKSISKGTFVSTLEQVCMIDIFDQIEFNDIETETESQVQFEEIKAKFDESHVQNIEEFKKAYEKYHLKMICDQKDIELRMEQLSKDRKTANYKSLLRQLKTINPTSYSKELGSTIQVNLKLQKKKDHFHHAIKKYKAKIEQLLEEAKQIENKEKELNLRIEFLQRELVFFRNPNDYIKTYLAKLCQKIALNQEEIRDEMRDIALIKLESEFVDKIKTNMYKKLSTNPDMIEDIFKMEEKLKEMKYKYTFADTKDETKVTTKYEIDYLQQLSAKMEKDIEKIDKNITKAVNQSSLTISQLSQCGIAIPGIPDLCKTLIRDSPVICK